MNFKEWIKNQSQASKDRIFQWIAIVSVFFLSGILLQGCGVFGKQDPTDKNLEAGLTGCLNDSGERFLSYIEGRTKESEVKENLDCIVDSLALFERFAVGSSNGMSTQEVHDFVDNVLITNTKVPFSMIEGIMSLKASWFGGSPTNLQKEDIQRAKKFMKFWSDLSVKYIPTFRALGQHKRGEIGLDSEGLLRVATDFGDMFETFGDRIFSQGAHVFDERSLENLIDGWVTIHDWDIDPAWASTFFQLKKILIAGADGVSPAEWPKLLRAIGMVTGVVIAMGHYDEKFHDGPNKVMNHFRNVLSRFKGIMGEVFSWNGGSIGWKELDQVIDSVPDTQWNDLIALRKSSLKDVIRPLTELVFASDVPQSIDPEFIRKLSEFFDEWVEGMNALDEVFAKALPFNEESFTSAEFSSYIQSLLTETQPDQKRKHLQHFIELLNAHQPMFPNDANQIQFTRDLMYSKRHLKNIYLMNFLSDLFLDHYGDGPFEFGHPTATKDNFYEVFEDIYDVLIDVNWFDEEERPTMYSRRFLDATVFTYQSDGNFLVNEREMTSFLAFMFSISVQSEKIRKDLTPICSAGVGRDAVGWEWLNADCFRREFKNRRATYWQRLPALREYWDSVDEEVRSLLWENWEVGARKNGFTSQAMASYDILNMMGMSHFIEGLYISFDKNNDETFQTQETLNVYKQRLKPTLREIDELKGRSDRTIEAAFTWTVDEGTKPDLTTLLGLAKFGVWVSTKPFWNLQSQRNKAYGSISIIK